MSAELRFPVLIFVLCFSFLMTACSCGDDDDSPSSGSGATGDDDDSDDDDDSAADDDVADDDDTIDDDTGTDDDTSDDDAVDDDTADDDIDDDTEECDGATHDPLIVQGKDLLGQGDHVAAYDAFADALDLCPDSADAEMGMLIADACWYVSWIKTWTDLIGLTLPASAQADATGGPKSDGTVLQKILRYSFLPVDREIYRLADDLIENHSNVNFVVDSVPVWVEQDVVVLDLGGEWDIADVSALRAFAGAFEGIARLMLSFDLDFDWASLINLDPPPGATPEELVHAYAEFFLGALNDPEFPDFLALLPEGAADLSASGVAYGHLLGDINTAFLAVRTETDEQEDDIIGYADLDADGMWDEGEPYRLPVAGELTDEQNELLLGFLQLSEDLGLAFLDGGADDPNPLLPDWFDIANLNFLLIYLQIIDPGQPLPHIPLPVGYWFYNPTTDGFHDLLQTIAQALYDATLP